MNVIVFFLSHADLKALPNLAHFFNEQRVHRYLIYVNAHLALPPTPENLERDARIELLSGLKDGGGSERMRLELELQKEWMKMPREDFLQAHAALFEGHPFKTTPMNDSFFGDRIPEMLMKLRPSMADHLTMGQFCILFPNQLPAKREAGRPPGPAKKPLTEEQRKKMADNLAKARAAKKKKPQLAGATA